MADVSASTAIGRRASAPTAKTNGIEPHAWLTDVLTRRPTTKDRGIDSLLPLA